jgi:hypothetical protein
MAQFVQAKHVVFEDVIEERDEDSYSEKIQSMASEAGDRFADITSAVSDALRKPTKTGGSCCRAVFEGIISCQCCALWY